MDRRMVLEMTDNARKAVKHGANSKYLLIEQKGHELSVFGASSVMSVLTKTGNIADDFSVQVDVDMLYSFVKAMTEDEIVLKQEGNFLRLTCGKAVAELPVVKEEVYTMIPKRPQNCRTFQNEDLKDFASQVSHALGSFESDPKQGSIYLEFGETGLKATALDGNRFSIRDSLQGGEVLASVLVSGKPLTEALAMLESETLSIAIPDSGNYIFVSDSRTEITVTTTVGPYFDLSRVVSRFDQNPIIMTGDTKEIIDALQLVRLTEDSKSPVRFTFDKTGMTLFGKGQIYAARTHVDCPMYGAGDQESVEIGLRTDYVIEAVKSLPEEDIRYEIPRTRATPLIIKAGELGLECILPIAIR